MTSRAMAAMYDFSLVSQVAKCSFGMTEAARTASSPSTSAAPATEVLLLETIGIVFDALADKGAVVRESAQYAIDAMFATLKEPALLSGLLRALMAYLRSSGSKWQGKQAAFILIGKMAEKAIKADQTSGEVFLKDVMGRELEALIPVVESGMHDLKDQVSKSAVKTTNTLTKLLSNEDVAKHVPTLVATMNMPSKETLTKAIHALSQTTFVQTVTSPVLALLTPLLERSLNSPQTSQEVLRQTVVVTENLTKLVHDPVEAREFLPRLQPGVKRVLDTASIPAVRELAKSANDVMLKAMRVRNGNEENTIGERISTAEVEGELAVRAASVMPKEHFATWETKLKSYIAAMAREVIVIREWSRLAGCIAPYLADLVGEEAANSIAAAVEKWAKETDHARFGNIGIVDDEFANEVEVVNANFSLAYGGMMLLNHTNLRLHKGHRYGLCGRNGAGKSTLMRSIAEGKLEGFPSKDELRTCFVEHRSQGDENLLPIVEYIRNSLVADNLGDEFLGDDGTEKIKETLRSVGFEGERVDFKVGELSGGWKMKLALAEAMLKKAEVLLLDEPTNHLDVGNVKWLENYLKTHTNITSLIVSHDSGFLDEVCTDIIHYENKKLVYYKGNLADFVKVRPEGKAYYTLSSSTVQFKFPPPGILTGVSSRTRSILRMTNATFTYPGAAKPSLYNVTCSLTLSSRVGLLGGNGAGKSTLIKVLTGEVIPQQGKVEKHPNLRVGYLSQHSLEPLQFHLDKTPSQYLQWRYAHGDDREVLMKATRKLTPEEEEQMAKPIDLGDGSGPRRIQNIVGRQKWKKSFQYEISWVGLGPKFNTMISRETMMKHGFFKLIQEFDDHEASREGLGFRKLEAADIRQHFEDVGLDADLAEHNEIGGMSGGQKVKIVIAGAMWNNPHLLVLDEPTNYLDRESLGGLSHAIREFKGGVIVISHNQEFVSALCNEHWTVEAGRVTAATKTAADLSKFEGLSVSGTTTPAPNSAVASAVTSAAASATSSAVNSDAEEEMRFKGRKFPKKKKLTRAQQKEREVRRRLRHIEWLNSPKGTPKPVDTDDEAE
ncbi:P-loop containing nucleoside triphosphate hydrolase protein [Sphaerosporella brunnea]|uniref:P-loop containing nucleoside triphosphate hydrolase protein n=2 Tax=Sphaerosporella brunnea TaxID=1250544 RepID=A0A5J5ED75_9PEZI|nr:P-loop containing nucleoside triphosphate hydrolase protein [Sphaerosporella brunnea]